MAKQKNVKEIKEKHKAENEIAEESEFSPEVERIYKIILRVMSWIVGSAIFLVIILFYFNSPTIDSISQVIFYIGIVTLLVFIVIELIGNNVKNMLSRIIDTNADAKSTPHR
jgi:hypothetical protein